jgi:effector-binding domain-containing protein
MSVLKKILLGLVVLVLLVILVGLFLPSSAHVERSTTIDAPPATIFALLNGFRSFNKWSPWAQRDPQAEYIYEGPDSGVGATMRWASQNPQMGSGFQKITASEPYKGIQTHLDFGSQGTAQAFFDLEPAAAGTVVTWGFDTDFGVNLVSRYMGLMFDNWIGADYEAGLANLKILAEGLPKQDWTDLEIAVVDVEPAVIVYTATGSTWDPAAIGEAYAEAYRQIVSFLAANKLESSGSPLAVTTSSNEEGWQFDAGIAIDEMPAIEIDPASPIQIRQTRGAMAVRGVSVGSYADLSADWDKVRAWIAAHGYEEAGLPWEEYVSDPEDTPEEELITHLYLPVS